MKIKSVLKILQLLLMLSSIFAGEKKYVTIFGTVTDSITGEPIKTAQIIILNSGYGTITDENGYYQLTIPKGEYCIQFQMAGYRSDTVTVNLLYNKSIECNISLTILPYHGKEVEIVESMPNLFKNIMDLDVDITNLSTVPALGEVDVLKVVQSFPGVVIVSDYSNTIYVRGSPPDQTQICFDDVPILNPYHLGNIFSVFNAEGARTVEFSPGIRDAQYGGYLGGKINIIPKTGADIHNYKTRLSAGLLSSGVTFGRKFGKTQIFFAGRRNYYDKLWEIMGDDPEYYFYDTQGSIVFPINNNQSISIHAFYSRDVLCDVLSYDEEKVEGLIQPKWGNRILSFKWQDNPNRNLLIKSHVYYSSNTMFSNTLYNDIDNQINELACRLNIFRIGQHHNFRTGLEYKYLRYEYNWHTDEYSELANLVRPPQKIFFDNAPADYQYEKNGWQSSFYIQDEYKIDILTSFIAGVRSTWFHLSKDFCLEPGFQLKRTLTQNIAITTSYSQHVQNYYTLKNQIIASLFAPFTITFPIMKGQEPLFSKYFSCGLDWRLTGTTLFKIEGYHKLMKNIPVLSDVYPYKIITQKQTASGLDIWLEETGWKNLNLSANYSLNYAYIIQGNQKYFADYDRRHNLKIVLKYPWKKGWDVEIAGYYLSGLPYTPVVGKYPDIGGREVTEELIVNLDYRSGYGGWSFVRGEKNSSRFSPYHRVDIGASKTCSFKKSQLCFKFQVINVYNRKNPLFHTYEDEDATEPSIVTQFNTPIIPSFQVNFEF